MDHEAGNLLTAVCEAIEAAGEGIQCVDAGAVALAKTYAAAIDEAVDSGDAQTMTKALYLGPHLLNALKELGCTPAGRTAIAGKLTGTKSAADAGPATGLGKFRVVG